MSRGHSIFENPDGSCLCSCGERFPAVITAAVHALPFLAGDLAADTAADPTSTHADVERAADNLDRARRLYSP